MKSKGNPHLTRRQAAALKNNAGKKTKDDNVLELQSIVSEQKMALEKMELAEKEKEDEILKMRANMEQLSQTLNNVTKDRVLSVEGYTSGIGGEVNISPSYTQDLANIQASIKVSNVFQEFDSNRSGPPVEKQYLIGRYSKRPWTPHEDQHLIHLVNSARDKPEWTDIAKLLAGRCGKQCRERWVNHLSPHVSKAAWSEWEDDIIFTTRDVRLLFRFRVNLILL